MPVPAGVLNFPHIPVCCVHARSDGAAPVVVIYHERIQIPVPAEFLNFPHISVCCVQRRRDSAVSDAVGGHLFFDTSLFAITNNHLADTVAAKSVSAVSGVKCYKKRAIVRATSPFLQPIGDRLHCRRTQIDRLSLRTASLAKNSQSLTDWVKVTNTQLADFVATQSITPQQAQQSIVS